MKIQHRLYLGRGTPAGEVENDELDHFLATVVAPLFPGFTIYNSFGWWKGERERTVILEIIAQDEPANTAKLEGIAQTYKGWFQQEAVGWSQTPVQWWVV